MNARMVFLLVIIAAVVVLVACGEAPATNAQVNCTQERQSSPHWEDWSPHCRPFEMNRHPGDMRGNPVDPELYYRLSVIAEATSGHIAFLYDLGNGQQALVVARGDTGRWYEITRGYILPDAFAETNLSWSGTDLILTTPSETSVYPTRVS